MKLATSSSTTTTTPTQHMLSLLVFSLLLLLALKPSSSSSLSSSSSSSTKKLDVVDETNKKNVHVPVGKDGDGEYTASTKGCFDVINTARPLILDEIIKQQQQQQQQQQQPPSTSTSTSAYHIADYGTADGGTSLGLIYDMVRTLRGANENEYATKTTTTTTKPENEREVVVHYEDQVTNEWQVCVLC